jgi:hypothetical protein
MQVQRRHLAAVGAELVQRLVRPGLASKGASAPRRGPVDVGLAHGRGLIKRKALAAGVRPASRAPCARNQTSTAPPLFPWHRACGWALTLASRRRRPNHNAPPRVVACTGRSAVEPPTDKRTKEQTKMGIGVSLLLIAVGAILRWAVVAHVNGVALGTIGVILIVVGAVGLVLSLVFWGPWPRRQVRREQVRDDSGRSYERVERVSDSGV